LIKRGWVAEVIFTEGTKIQRSWVDGTVGDEYWWWSRWL